MFPNKYPEINEIVLFTVSKIDEFAVYGVLPEYNNINAMMIFAEVTARRIKSINQHIRDNQQIPVNVIQVDENRGYINVSKKSVTPEEKDAFMNEYAKRKKISTLIYKLTLHYKCDMKDIYEPLYKLIPTYTNLYEAMYAIKFKNSILDDVELSNEIKKDIISNLDRIFSVPLQTFSGEIKIQCLNIDGIEVIKESIKNTKNIMSHHKVNIYYIAAPSYEIRMNGYYSNETEEIFKEFCQNLNEYIKIKDGMCQFVKMITLDKDDSSQDNTDESDSN
jgi:translation initiation factor 2 subunit 1